MRQSVIDHCTRDLCDLRGFDRTKLMHLEEGYVEFRAYPGPDCANSIGTVHGGFLMALIDQAVACAGESLGSVTITQGLNATFIRPGLLTDEFIHIVSRVEYEGAKTMLVEVEMFNPAGKTLLRATATLFRTDMVL